MVETEKIESSGSLRLTLWNMAGLGKENEFMEFLKDSQSLRKSQDKVVNGEGRNLLKICNELGISILNARVRDDQLGAITFIGRNELDSNAIIVIRIGTTRGIEIKNLEILPRTESDHLPVVLTLRTEGCFEQEEEHKQAKDDTQEDPEQGFKFRWKKEKVEEYRAQWTKEWESQAREENNDKWSHLLETTRTAARRCEMEKRVMKPNKITRPWFNKECRQKKKDFSKHLKDI
ncbi:hypothetical protein KQX54_003432 [Cotesia glomerata]|uniref:Uncharacterized protein n=1 Tax=Cotesia glomerata TaxID=32391 RepID=A0AAV7IZ42_COTGL|nr:hypothetical protein KQX54_003432 [Cotesia glomerata]